ncbi:unnamed protein product, partial [Closterium sp. NIES-54]
MAVRLCVGLLLVTAFATLEIVPASGKPLILHRAYCASPAVRRIRHRISDPFHRLDPGASRRSPHLLPPLVLSAISRPSVSRPRQDVGASVLQDLPRASVVLILPAPPSWIPPAPPFHSAGHPAHPPARPPSPLIWRTYAFPQPLRLEGSGSDADAANGRRQVNPGPPREAATYLSPLWNAGALGTPAAGPKCRNAFPARALCKFVDDLATTMRVAVDTRDGKLVRIGVYQIYQKFHRDLPPTKQYAYGLNQRTAAFPGPTILAQKGKDTQIYWSNHIKDKKHMIQLDDTLMIPMPKKGGVPIVPHRHGGETHSTYDGHPQAWFTQFGDKGPTYSTQLYHYHNSQRPSIVWYHDHAIAITRINVMAGMAGLYVIMDPKGEEKEINKWAPLPGGPFFMPLAIADRIFFPNGSVNYPVDGVVPKEHPHWQPEFFGDTITVNGKVWPYLRVRRALYRLPILGASNARFYHLRFQCAVRGDYHDFKPPFRGPIIPMTQ